MVDAADARVLAVLTRAPSSGGKSRLFAGLNRAPDPQLLEALLLDTLDGASSPGVRLVVAVTPGSACEEVRKVLSRLPPSPLRGFGAAGKPAPTYEPVPTYDVIPQGEGDLGERMRATMAGLFARGAHAVALIGSDLPHITASPVTAAFAALADDPDALVLGPATDGGYYLLAATRVPEVFTGVEWGSSRVLDQTQRVASTLGFRVRLLPALADVDSADDLRLLSQSDRAPRTAAWLRAHDLHG